MPRRFLLGELNTKFKLVCSKQVKLVRFETLLPVGPVRRDGSIRRIPPAGQFRVNAALAAAEKGEREKEVDWAILNIRDDVFSRGSEL